MNDAKPTLKNILFLRSLRIHKWGGVEKWMFEVGKGLRERGYNVIYGARPGSRFNNYAKEHSFKYYDIKFSSDMNPIISYNLKKLIKSENIELICAGEEKELRLLAPVYWFGKRPAIVIRKGAPLIKNRLRFKIVYDRLVDAVITPSNALGDYLLDLLPWLKSNKINVLHNGVLIPENKQKGIFRKELEINERTFLAVIIGRLNTPKGHTDLIHAIGKIKNKLEHTIVAVVGGGEDESQLREEVKRLDLSGIVKFLGHRNDVDQILADADLQVHPSHSEGMPNAILEGLAYAVPIIATNIPGIKEIDMNKNVIEFVQPNNPDELARIFLKLKSDSSFRISLGERGRNHVKKYFSLEKMISGAENIFIDSYRSGDNK